MSSLGLRRGETLVVSLPIVDSRISLAPQVDAGLASAPLPPPPPSVTESSPRHRRLTHHHHLTDAERHQRLAKAGAAAAARLRELTATAAASTLKAVDSDSAHQAAGGSHEAQQLAASKLQSADLASLPSYEGAGEPAPLTQHQEQLRLPLSRSGRLVFNLLLGLRGSSLKKRQRQLGSTSTSGDNVAHSEESEISSESDDDGTHGRIYRYADTLINMPPPLSSNGPVSSVERRHGYSILGAILSHSIASQIMEAAVADAMAREAATAQLLELEEEEKSRAAKKLKPKAGRSKGAGDSSAHTTAANERKPSEASEDRDDSRTFADAALTPVPSAANALPIGITSQTVTPAESSAATVAVSAASNDDDDEADDDLSDSDFTQPGPRPKGHRQTPQKGRRAAPSSMASAAALRHQTAVSTGLQQALQATSGKRASVDALSAPLPARASVGHPALSPAQHTAAIAAAGAHTSAKVSVRSAAASHTPSGPVVVAAVQRASMLPHTTATASKASTSTRHAAAAQSQHPGGPAVRRTDSTSTIPTTTAPATRDQTTRTAPVARGSAARAGATTSAVPARAGIPGQRVDGDVLLAGDSASSQPQIRQPAQRRSEESRSPAAEHLAVPWLAATPMPIAPQSRSDLPGGYPAVLQSMAAASHFRDSTHSAQGMNDERTALDLNLGIVPTDSCVEEELPSTLGFNVDSLVQVLDNHPAQQSLRLQPSSLGLGYGVPASQERLRGTAFATEYPVLAMADPSASASARAPVKSAGLESIGTTLATPRDTSTSYSHTPAVHDRAAAAVPAPAVCSACGAAVLSSAARFCSGCGTRLPVTSTTPTNATIAVFPATPTEVALRTLTHMRPPMRVHTWPQSQDPAPGPAAPTATNGAWPLGAVPSSSWPRGDSLAAVTPPPLFNRADLHPWSRDDAPTSLLPLHESGTAGAIPVVSEAARVAANNAVDVAAPLSQLQQLQQQFMALQLTGVGSNAMGDLRVRMAARQHLDPWPAQPHNDAVTEAPTWAARRPHDAEHEAQTGAVPPVLNAHHDALPTSGDALFSVLAPAFAPLSLVTPVIKFTA